VADHVGHGKPTFRQQRPGRGTERIDETGAHRDRNCAHRRPGTSTTTVYATAAGTPHRRIRGVLSQNTRDAGAIWETNPHFSCPSASDAGRLDARESKFVPEPSRSAPGHRNLRRLTPWPLGPGAVAVSHAGAEATGGACGADAPVSHTVPGRRRRSPQLIDGKSESQPLGGPLRPRPIRIVVQ